MSFLNLDNDYQNPPPKPVRNSEYIEILQSPDLDKFNNIFDEAFKEQNQTTTATVSVNNLNQHNVLLNQKKDSNDNEWEDLSQDEFVSELQHSNEDNIIRAENNISHSQQKKQILYEEPPTEVLNNYLFLNLKTFF